MVTKTHPPKNTGGGGFVFEDKVAAWYFLCMLSHFSPFDDALGFPVRVDFQANGWELDDALVTTNSQLGEHRFAVSIKSNQQFTAKKAPSDFVNRIWYHWNSLDKENFFDKEKDFLVLITSPLSDAAQKSISELMNKALLANPENFVKDILTPGWADENQRELFKSFLPSDKYIQSPEAETVSLLQRLRFIAYDFDSIPSSDFQRAISFCKKNVKSYSEIDANNLWNLLCAIAAKYRPKAGSITLQKLLAEIGNQVVLSEYPDYKADWEKLNRQSIQMANRVHSTLGTDLHISRENVLNELGNTTKENRLILVQGNSGSGKSALLKEFYLSKISAKIPAIWLDINVLEDTTFQSFEHGLGLQYSLKELFEQVRSSDAFIILEGIDRLYDERAFANLVMFLTLISELNSQGRWHIILSSQTKEWERVSGQFSRLHFNKKWFLFPITEVTPQELVEGVRKYPQLVQLLLQPRLETIFRNLKVLDLVVRNIETEQNIDLASLLNEASIAEWFWKSNIKIGSSHIARGKCVRSLSETLADELRAFIHVDRLEDNEAVQSLIESQIIYLDENDRLSFMHDLYADWVRFHTIQTQENLISFFKNRHDRPLWFRAMRLYALDLLAKQEFLKWKTLFDQLNSANYYSLANALLEAPIFSTNSFEHLNALLPTLQQEDGNNLRQLLSNFMMFGTQPDQEMVLLTTQRGLDAVTARTFYRIPYWLLWIGVLQFLYANKEIVLMVAKQEVARIIELWLSTTPINTRMRPEMCEMALQLGCYAYEHRKNYSIKDEDIELFYRCLFLAVPEKTEDVIRIALSAAQRISVDEVTENIPQQEVFTLSDICGRLTVYGPWENGPKANVDRNFKKVALNSEKLVRLFQLNPQVAREIVLATIIKAPYTKGEYESYGLDYRTELDTDQLFYPPFYLSGPFLNFLKINFEEGLKLIIELVDFAIDRLIDNEKEAASKKEEQTQKKDSFWDMWRVEPFNTNVILYDGEQKKSYIGGKRAYDTLSGRGICSDAVVVALMSLEQYFYEQIEQEKDVLKEIDLTLKYAQNTAILAVLCNVGKKKNELFHGALKALLSCAEVYSWDIESVVTPLLHTNPGSMPLNEFLWNLGQKYFSQQHRKIELRSIAINLMLHKPKMRIFFDALVLHFKEELEKSSKNADLKENMITALDYSNYVFEEQSDGQILAVNIKEKKLQEQDPNRDKEMRIHHLLLILPLECRKVLDAKKICDDLDLEALWEQWSFLWAEYIKSPKQLTPIGGNRIGDEAVNAISACIPVFLFHEKWCAKSSEREKTIVMVIDHLVQNPPVRDFNFGQVHDLSWEFFLIEAVTFLWCRYPQEKKWRELVASNIITHNLKVIQIIFLVASQSKLSLNDDFSCLRRLAIEWAYLKPYSYALQRTEDDLGVRQEELRKARSESNDWCKKKIQYFIEGKSLPLPGNWGECNEIDQLGTLKKINYFWLPNNDYVAMDVIYSANLWLPPLSANLGEVDRKDVVNAWHNIIDLMISNRQNRESYRDDLPNEDECKILDQVGTILPYLKEGEKPDLLWGPIFDLSEKNEVWANRMLHHIHDSALRADALPDFYISLVQSLNLNVFETNSKVGKWSSYKREWESLIGIDWFNKNAWEEKHIKCVNELKEVYLLWMEHVPINSERLRCFAEWLVMPGAIPMRVDGLFWILEKVNSHNIKLSECAESFVHLLNLIWSNDQEIIRSNPNYFQKFRELLLLLQKDGNPFSLELFHRIENL